MNPNMMNSDKIEAIKKFFSKSSSEDDLRNLFLWFNSAKGHDEINHALDEEWKSAGDGQTIPIDSAKILTNIKNGIKSRKSYSLKANINRVLPYAAVFLAIIGLASLFFYNQNSINRSDLKNLTYSTVIVENGQRSKIILPDSSIVWLNSGTTISYNNDFAVANRNIRLIGQAFFEVVKNEKVPLFVHCDDLVVKVLGTKFDVDAYPENQKISVVLESGSVQLLYDGDKDFNYQLNPGQIAEFDAGSTKVMKRTADIEKLTSWRNGALVFKNDPMGLVIKKLERWYNIQFEVVDPAVYNSIFTGTIRNESYEQILKLIEYSCPVDFQIKGNGNLGSIPQIKVLKKKY
jgi:ferric-dicitrate binding protein FerR (iron transport regulator)